jgi:anti-sigma factor RsiW
MSGAPPLTCRELVEFLLEYWEDRLDPEQRRRFDEHLALCPHCRDYLESYRRTVSLGAAAFEDEDLAEAPAELIEALLRSRES